MVKKRIIPKFLIKGGRLVKGVGFFNNMREAGNPVSTARVYDSYGVDEMIFLDIDASLSGETVSTDIIERVSEEIFMPFTVGGGLTTVGEIEDLLASGADKVSVTSIAVENPAFVQAAASRFGDQCIVVNIDYIMDGGEAWVVSKCGTERTRRTVAEFALEMEDRGAGELMLTSISRDSYGWIRFGCHP